MFSCYTYDGADEVRFTAPGVTQATLACPCHEGDEADVIPSTVLCAYRMPLQRHSQAGNDLNAGRHRRDRRPSELEDRHTGRGERI